MNPLIERAAMGLAHLYGQETAHERFQVHATAVCEHIQIVPESVLIHAEEYSGIPREQLVAAWRAIWMSAEELRDDPYKPAPKIPMLWPSQESLRPK